jgi:hypothetical protein
MRRFSFLSLDFHAVIDDNSYMNRFTSTKELDMQSLLNAGFVVAGADENGVSFFTKTLDDHRVIVAGNESNDGQCWGADVYANVEDFKNGVNVKHVAGVYASADELVDMLRSEKLID